MRVYTFRAATRGADPGTFASLGLVLDEAQMEEALHDMEGGPVAPPAIVQLAVVPSCRHGVMLLRSRALALSFLPQRCLACRMCADPLLHFTLLAHCPRPLTRHDGQVDVGEFIRWSAARTD